MEGWVLALEEQNCVVSAVDPTGADPRRVPDKTHCFKYERRHEREAPLTDLMQLEAMDDGMVGELRLLLSTLQRNLGFYGGLPRSALSIPTPLYALPPALPKLGPRMMTQEDNFERSRLGRLFSYKWRGISAPGITLSKQASPSSMHSWVEKKTVGCSWRWQRPIPG